MQLSNDKEEGDEDDEDCDLVQPPATKRIRKNYDRIRKFQLEWQEKVPWTEPITPDEKLHVVHCRPYSVVDGKGRLLAPKFYTLCKHEGCCKANRDMPRKDVKKGNVFVVKSCRHFSTMERKKKNSNC